ncbi:MAG TPA: UDP-2,3-diacylglucosamine diphosphatase LpxI [Opitutales bacterium]|nr:UDP-2,3-diacylglucosamine diphosphatase LpxI [Opitutales bacterium]
MKPPHPSAAGSSRFLPKHFAADRPVAIIAGRGLYPQLTAKALRAAGVPVRLVGFHDETAPELMDTFAGHEREIIKVGQLGHLLKALRKLEAGAAIMAGQIRPRKLFDGLHPDLKAIAILATLKERNAESIFGAIAKEIEALGIPLLDARAFLDQELADEGVMTGGRAKIDDEALAFGVRLARSVAQLDIGQGVVVSGGTVLAVEAFEGTDPMLRRAGEFGAKEPLFVKAAKPRQDFRFDVPVFGRATLAVMREAKIAAAALEAGSTLILEKTEVVAEAKVAGIQLIGYRAEK